MFGFAFVLTFPIFLVLIVVDDSCCAAFTSANIPRKPPARLRHRAKPSSGSRFIHSSTSNRIALPRCYLTAVRDGSASPEDDANSKTTIKPPRFILPLIVGSQFAGTSLWFAGNAVLPDLIQAWDLPIRSARIRSYLTSVVQIGFIAGTLLSARTNLVDRFHPTRIFLWAACTGALLNAIIPLVPVVVGSTSTPCLVGLVLLRFLTGVALAGIYPVGMKIAADWYDSEQLGRSLGWLVGALAVGSGVPFLLQQLNNQSWRTLLWETSGLAVLGGLAIGFRVPDGPYRQKVAMQQSSLDHPSSKVMWDLFRQDDFRAAAMGYFGHMWELYAFWTWCPVVWKAYIQSQPSIALSWDASAVTFAILASGGIGCVLGGFLSAKIGSASVACFSLALSGSLCLLSPIIYQGPPTLVLIAYLVWGFAVVADSPQFSSLVATTAPAANKGTALTIVNCIGFAITVGSIQLLGVPIPERYLFLLLAPGPFIGLWNMRYLVGDKRKKTKLS